MNCIGAERSFQALPAWADHVWEVASGGSIVVVVEVGKSGSRAWGGWMSCIYAGVRGVLGQNGELGGETAKDINLVGFLC